MTAYAMLSPGDPAPWFAQRSFANPRYVIDTAAGRYVVLLFLGSAADAQSQAAVAAVLRRSDVFNDEHASCFAVSVDPADEQAGRLADRYPGFRVLWDHDGKVSRLYGAMPREAPAVGEPVSLRRFWVVLDPTLAVMRLVPFTADRSDITSVLDYVAGLEPPGRQLGFEVQAPILVLANVFEPELCRHLIGLYEQHGGVESGFMRDVGGRTVAIEDHAHKRRRDYLIDDPKVMEATRARFVRRVVPMIARAHQFKVTRMERYVVSCYAAEDVAHFRAHRDNTTKATAHRRFAASVNLNDEFDGGEVSFPEYGRQSYKAPVGGAVVFSCSMLHAVSKVTRGRRYAFLPFLYDEEAARMREANIKHLGDGSATYKSGLE